MPGSSRHAPATAGLLLVVLVCAIAIPVFIILWAWGGGGFYPGTMGMWGWAFPMTGMAILGLIVGLILLVRGGEAAAWPAYAMPVYPQAGAPPQAATPLDIVDARYARGEITRDEYLRIREDLQQRGP